MPFRVVGYNKPIDDSSLKAMRQSVLDLVQWTTYEFQQIASALVSTEADKIWNTAPPKPRQGTQAYADGTHWNPGFGEGFYEYTSAGWVPMFVNATSVPPSSLVPASWLTAWTPYTPTVAATSGAFGSASATGRYLQMGKSVFVQFTATITTVGTASGQVLVSLPVAPHSGVAYILAGVVSNTGAALSVIVGPSGAVIISYNGGTAIAAGAQLSATGIYEAA